MLQVGIWVQKTEQNVSGKSGPLKSASLDPCKPLGVVMKQKRVMPRIATRERHATKSTRAMSALLPNPLENVRQVTAPGQSRPTALSHRLHPGAKPLDVGPGGVRMPGNSGLVILSLIVLDPIPEQAGILLERFEKDPG